MRTKIVSVITALSLTVGLAACGNDLFTDAPVTTVKKQILEIPSAADEEGYWLYDSLDNGATVAALGISQDDSFHMLFVRCKWSSEGDELDIFWSFLNSALAFGPSITVKYNKYGGEVKEKWLESSDNTAVFAPNAVQFARYLIANRDNILSLSYIDSHNNSNAAIFIIFNSNTRSKG